MKSAIILAAGKGTRMQSQHNKMMHQVSNKPMIGHIVDTLKSAGVENIVVVVGYASDEIKNYLKDSVQYAMQTEMLGTGHAVMQVDQFKGIEGNTVIMNGDGPLIQKETIEQAFASNESCDMTVVSTVLDDGAHYGRIIRDASNNVVRIKEAKDCNEEEYKVCEINTGMFCINTQLMYRYIDNLKNNNAQNEYYLTDLLEVFINNGHKVNAMIAADNDEVMGVNDRYELSLAQEWLTRHTNTRHMRNGVTIVDPKSTYIDVDVVIGKDTIIEPNVTIKGNSVIGDNVKLISGSYIDNGIIGDGVTIDNSKIVDSSVGKDSVVGPMSHLRNGCKIGEKCRIGNFVEMKNTEFGDGSKCAHLTYLGDSLFGKNINVGCGVVTVNYDGCHKFQTVVKDGAFIGSNVNIIAPVTIGENALLAAGSTITSDVEAGDMGIARSKQEVIKGYGIKYKEKKSK